MTLRTFEKVLVSASLTGLLSVASASHAQTSVEFDSSAGLPSAQGWLSDSQLAAALVETTAGALYEMNTVGAAGTFSGPMHLWHKAVSATVGTAFTLEFDLQVVAGGGHNLFDAGIVVMVNWTGPGIGGGPTGRGSMVYFDVGEIGFGDLSAAAAVTTTDLNNYRFEVSATGLMDVYVNGSLVMSRAGVAPNGFIAFGDQTNDGGGPDGQFRIDDIQLITA